MALLSMSGAMHIQLTTVKWSCALPVILTQGKVVKSNLLCRAAYLKCSEPEKFMLIIAN